MWKAAWDVPQRYLSKRPVIVDFFKRNILAGSLYIMI